MDLTDLVESVLAKEAMAVAKVANAVSTADIELRHVVFQACVRFVGDCETSECNFDKKGRVSKENMPPAGAVFHDKTGLDTKYLPIFAVDVEHASCDFRKLCFPEPIRDNSGPKICVVTGPTGSGKTTSLIAAASQAVDPVAFISFGHDDSKRVLEVFRQLIKAFEGLIQRDAKFGSEKLRCHVLLPLATKLLRGLISDRLNYVRQLDSPGARIRAQVDTALYNMARKDTHAFSYGLDDFDAVHIIFDECNVLFDEKLFVPSADAKKHPSNLLSLFIEAALSLSRKCTVSVSGTLQRISAYTRGALSGSGTYKGELIYVSPGPLSREQIESFFDRRKAHIIAQKVHSEEGGLQFISDRLAGARARTLGFLFASHEPRETSLSELVASAFVRTAEIILERIQVSNIGLDVLLCGILDPDQLKSSQANGGSTLMTAFGIVEPENRPKPSTVHGDRPEKEEQDHRVCTVEPSANKCWSEGFLHEEEVRPSATTALLQRSELNSELTKITATAKAINPSCGGFYAEVMLAAVVARNSGLLFNKFLRSESVARFGFAKRAAETDVHMSVARNTQETVRLVNEFVGLRGTYGVMRVILPDRLCGADVVVLWRDLVIFFSLKWTNRAECAKSAKQASGHRATPRHLEAFEKLKDSKFVRVVLCLHKSGSGGCEQDLDFERLGNTELARQFSDRSTWYHVGIEDDGLHRCVTPIEVAKELMQAEPVTVLGADSRKRSKSLVVEKNDGPEMKKRRVE